MDNANTAVVVEDRSLSAEIADSGVGWRIEQWAGDDYACFVEERFIGARATLGMARSLIERYNTPDPS